MYLPEHFRESDIESLLDFIEHHGFATWVLSLDNQIYADHLPLYLNRQDGVYGTLQGHVSRANSMWAHCSQGVDSLAVFQGANAYISPSYYPSKHQHGKVVPTWNYAVVHAQGKARAVEDRDWLIQHLTRITAQHEKHQAQPWQLSDAPEDFLSQLLDAIVGIELPIEKLTGKWKMSQNRPRADKLGAAQGLRAQAGEDNYLAVANIIERYVEQQD